LQPECSEYRDYKSCGTRGVKEQGGMPPCFVFSYVWIVKFTENFGIIPIIRIFAGNRQLNDG
jgi:hypothetical protein